VAVLTPQGNGQNTPIQTSYIHADHLNTPRVISKATGEIQWRWDSDAFGSIAANEDPSLTGQRFRYNLRFPGQVYDEETGLHYNYFRDYNPSTGRYIQSDPIGLAGGLNTYTYVGGNPLSLIDPYGLDSQESWAAVGTLGLVGLPLQLVLRKMPLVMQGSQVYPARIMALRMHLDIVSGNAE
jgi:RHS repeat-associated protein